MRVYGALICATLLAACAPGDASLLSPSLIVGDTIPEPLTNKAGSASLGAAIFVERDRGHCVLCHAVSNLDAPFQGDIGPDLSDVGARLTARQIRLRIVDASILNPETVMPPYYRTQGLHQVAEAHIGAPVLPAQDIEDLIAYLMSLKG